jgi:hypothetical protein
MNSTKLSGKDIVEIIKACGEAGVGRLSVGDLTIAYGDFAKEEPKIELPTTVNEARLQAMSRQLEIEQQQPSPDADDADLVLTDPVAWQNRELGLVSEASDEAV